MQKNGDLILAFDVGYRSIGWAVLKAPSDGERELLGTGSVIFQPDDCLASQRRAFRRQRRHIRSTRERIERIKRLLLWKGVLSPEQADPKARPNPWFDAARVLGSRGEVKLDWPRLWNVLRWYAHNRGYDGNKAWSREIDASAKEDAEKVQNALSLFQKYGTRTMAETWCAISGLDPKKKKVSCHVSGPERPKGRNAAFPRESVVKEVAEILRAHVGHLDGLDESLVAALMEDWRRLSSPEVVVPNAYKGGLLFGQIIPRFDNRIIATCPFTYEERFQEVLAETGDESKAEEAARKFAKVPSAASVEFRRYRWAMQLANVKVRDSNGLRNLHPEERRAIDAEMKARGALTKGEFKKLVRTLEGINADNLDQMFALPEAEKALVMDRARHFMLSGSFAEVLGKLPERFRKRLYGQLRKGKSVRLEEARSWLGGDTFEFDAAIDAHVDTAATRSSPKARATTRESVLATILRVEPLAGRAPFSRERMTMATNYVFETNRHPSEEGGPLYRSEAIRNAQQQRAIDEQTNNHLVRHRLLILQRLHSDILSNYAECNLGRVKQLVIEVNRDLRTFSGMTAKQIAQDMGLRQSNFKKVSEKLEDKLEGTDARISSSLIRTARIADDLGWTCPYTGKPFDVHDLVNRRVDMDHIVPRSQRPSDSLDSMVITFNEVNRWKGKRTALQFVDDEQGQTVPGMAQVNIKPLSTFIKDVEGFESFKGHDDDIKRKRNRKRLLLLRNYVGKEFVPRDLTQTSQLVRLAAQVLEKHYSAETSKPVIVPLPGSVTGAVRKSWDVLGCLSAANSGILDTEQGISTPRVRTKTEIRDITHLHHGLDACVLAYAADILPKKGDAWELLSKRRLTLVAQQKARLIFKEGIKIDQDGYLRLLDLPKEAKAQIRDRLAERRVVQHVPKDQSGMRVEQNLRRVLSVKDGTARLTQRVRKLDGFLPPKAKEDEHAERIEKLIGLEAGKLTKLKAALVITENYGLSLDPEPTIIPFHKVWVRIRELREMNGGKSPKILRNGMLVRLSNTSKKRGMISRDGIWRVYSVQGSLKVDFVKADVIGRPKKGLVWREVSLVSLGVENIEILKHGFCGVADNDSIPESKGRDKKCPSTSSALTPRRPR